MIFKKKNIYINLETLLIKYLNSRVNLVAIA